MENFLKRNTFKIDREKRGKERAIEQINKKCA
jgi:hypothetical protein